MSMNKAIKYGKEYRKMYYGAKAIDPTCRNHGSCPYCYSNRQYRNKKLELKYNIKNIEREI